MSNPIPSSDVPVNVIQSQPQSDVKPDDEDSNAMPPVPIPLDEMELTNGGDPNMPQYGTANEFHMKDSPYTDWQKLVDAVRATINTTTPDNDSITRLGFMYVVVGKGTSLRRQNTHMMNVGLLLVEWCINNKYVCSMEEEILLAGAHCTVWFSMGVSADVYNMKRSIEFYEIAYKKIDVTENVQFILDYANALSFLGEFQKAYELMKLLTTKFEDHKDIPNFLFYTGIVLKALGRHDEAADYFFEATQIGPPKLFSKLEMMFIISRNIEQGSKNKDVALVDAYEMVYEHVVLEGV